MGHDQEVWKLQVIQSSRLHLNKPFKAQDAVTWLSPQQTCPGECCPLGGAASGPQLERGRHAESAQCFPATWPFLTYLWQVGNLAELDTLRDGDMHVCCTPWAIKGVFRGNFEAFFAVLLTWEHNSLVSWNSLYSCQQWNQISEKCCGWQGQLLRNYGVRGRKRHWIFFIAINSTEVS